MEQHNHFSEQDGSIPCCPYCGADPDYMQQSSCVLLIQEGEKHRVTVGDIQYIEADDKYVIFIVLEPNGQLKPIRICCSMSSIEQSDKFRNFQRIHKSYIVNLFKISSVSSDSVKLKHIPNKTLSIGGKYEISFEAALKKWHLFQ